MPRKIPIPQKEKEIGKRFREARMEKGLPMTELARRIGISPNTLSGYEHGQNPIPYFVAAKLAKELNCSQRWLAIGVRPKHPFIGINLMVEDEIINLIPPNAYFSKVYDQVLAEEFERMIQDICQARGRSSPSDDDDDDLESFFDDAVLFPDTSHKLHLVFKPIFWRAKTFSWAMPPKVKQEFIEEIIALTDRYLAPRRLEEYQRDPDEEAEKEHAKILEEVRAKLKSLGDSAAR